MQGAQPGRRSTKRPLLTLGLILGIAVLVAALGTASLLLLGGNPANNDRNRAALAVESYLTALSSGDADTALAHLADVPEEQTFLTRETLGQSLALGAITDLEVGTPAADLAVPVRYRIGGHPVETTHHAAPGPDGQWQVTDGLATAHVVRPKVPVLLNGIALDSDEIALFPGTYALSTGQPHLQFTEDTVAVSSAAAGPRISPQPELTEAGRDAFLQATRTALTKCLQQKSMAPRGCPQSAALPEGNTPLPETIEWKLATEPDWEHLQPQLSVADETRAELALPLAVTISLQVDTGTGIATIDANPLDFTSKVRAQMTEETVRVEFTR